jgi:hypothetical protein
VAVVLRFRFAGRLPGQEEEEEEEAVTVVSLG